MIKKNFRLKLILIIYKFNFPIYFIFINTKFNIDKIFINIIIIIFMKIISNNKISFIFIIIFKSKITEEEIFFNYYKRKIIFVIKSNKDKIVSLIEFIHNLYISNPILDSNIIPNFLNWIFIGNIIYLLWNFNCFNFQINCNKLINW